MSDLALATQGLEKRFGSLVVASDIARWRPVVQRARVRPD